MARDSNPTIPPAVLEAYDVAYHRVNTRPSAQRYWEHLQPSERATLGRSFRDAYQRHRSSFAFLLALDPQLAGEQAVIDVAHAIGFLTSETREWLSNEICKGTRRPSSRTRPSWNQDRGELTYKGIVIRRVRVGVGTRIVAILNGFEALGWPERIASIICDELCHRDAIRTLNKKLAIIRFLSDGTSKGIRWDVVEPHTV
jgi:hypothetical protein